MNDSSYLYPVLLAAVLGGLVLLYQPIAALAASGAGYVLIGMLLVAYAGLQSHLAVQDWKKHGSMRRIWTHYFGPTAPLVVFLYRTFGPATPDEQDETTTPSDA